MATTTGAEFDHITILDGANEVVHYLKDTAARNDIDSLKPWCPTNNGSMTESGITISNSGRLYSLNGTGTALCPANLRTNEITVSVLDGCVPWANRSETLPLKAGHSYRFSMQAWSYPYVGNDRKYDAYMLNVKNGNSTILSLKPGYAKTSARATTDDGTEAVFYCASNMNVSVQLSIMPGYDETYFTYSTSYNKILIGITDCTSNEHPPVYRESAGWNMTPPLQTVYTKEIQFPNNVSFNENSAAQLEKVRTGEFSGGSIILNETLLSETQVKRWNASLPDTGKLKTGSNSVTANYGTALGKSSKVTGEGGFAQGEMKTVTQGGRPIMVYTLAEGESSFATGSASVVYGDYAQAMGEGVTARHRAEHVFGQYNTNEASEATFDERGDFVEIVGNGTSFANLSNARTLDWDGNESLAGSITLGMGTADETTITAAQLKQLLALLT